MPESSHLLLAVLFSADLQNFLAGTRVCGSPSDGTKITVYAQTHFRAKSHCNDTGSFPKCTASFSSLSQTVILLAWGYAAGLARGDPEWATGGMQAVVTQECFNVYFLTPYIRLYQIWVVVTLTENCVQRFGWKKTKQLYFIKTFKTFRSTVIFFCPPRLLFLPCTERAVIA